MKTTAPLSQSQYGIYAECASHPGECFYNMPYLYRLDATTDPQRLCHAVEAAVMAHPTLFTHIELNDEGEPLQTVDDTEAFTLSEQPWQDPGTLVIPYNIYSDRLFRICLMKADDGAWLLFIDMHHIVADGTSIKILLDDIDAAYHGKTLQPEAMTMAQMAASEAEAATDEKKEEGRRWYAEHFDCGDLYSELLPDREETAKREASLLRTLSVSPDSVDRFCHDNGIYRSTLFTMAYALLLARYTADEQALFTTVVSGRTDKRFAHSIGMTVRTLPVFAKWTAQTTVADMLRAGEQQMSGCREHKAYAYSDVVADLGLQTASMFAWHANIFGTTELCGAPITTQRMGNSTLACPLYLKAFIRDKQFQVKAEYRADKYSETLIAQFLESYEAALNGLLTKERLADISIATEKQTELLDSFNRTDCDYDRQQTIVSLFSRQAKASPEATAVVFRDKRLSYADVDRMSDAIATLVSSKGLGREDVVSILIPRSEWMVVASLGVLKAGCAYQPLDPSYPTERLNFMMKDANARLLIADEQLRPLVDEYTGETLLTKDLNTLPVSSMPADPQPAPHDLFILLYTSGSTGVPKGCQLTHSNLVAFCHWYQRFYSLKAGDCVAAYASYGFDASMMDMYPALTCGATVCIVPEEMRLDLIALDEYFMQQGVTHSFMTTQVGYQFATTIDHPQSTPGTPHATLRHLSTGGEKLASLTPPKGYAFYNAYGPTECTIFTTIYQVEKKMKEIPIGKPLDNMRLYVVDQQGHRQPVGAAGELWVSGPQVGRGYLNRPEKTAEVFVGNPFATEEKDTDSTFSRCYRTGDIVRFLPTGDIQFVGRRDGQVKIRGFRIELKEVESVIREYPGIKDATVQAFEEGEGGGKFIAAYIVSDDKVDIEALNDFILEQKPPYMVPAVTMQIDAIPLNQNQKVNKRALPKPVREKADTTAEAANVPMNRLEEELKPMVAAIVGHDDFGILTPLGMAGLTSISAIKLAVQVKKRYSVNLDSRMLVKCGTLQTIENEIIAEKIIENSDTAAATKATGKETTATEKPSALQPSFPLSYAQTGVYFECLKSPTSTIYNIPYLLTFPAGTDAVRLADAVKQVVESHQELHVHFSTEGETIVQTTEGSVTTQVPVTEMSEERLSAYKNEFVQPFNLQRPPLYRFEVVTTEAGVRLLMDVHHLVFDGGSADLFIRQLCTLLDHRDIETEGYTYQHFVNDQQQAESGDTFKAAQQFFAEKLATCEGASEIAPDLPKTDKQGLIGEAVCKPDFAAATDFCRRHTITPAHLFLAATAYVVSRYTNSRDVFLCTVSSGRSNLKIADTVGMFVNTLPLALSIGEGSVDDYLKSVSDTFDQTIGHEDYPFARIAADYAFRPAIAYAYQVGVLQQYSVGGQPLEQELLELRVPKFKLNIKIEDRGVVVQYDDTLYSHRLATALAESIVTVAQHITAQPEGKVRALSIVSQRQEEELANIRTTATGDAPFRLFHECISHYAQQQPAHEALVACDARFTYGEMDRTTNRIAQALRSHGVKEHDRVALLLPRTSRLILAMFGVMKAGAAYIPCDPDYPADRVRLILEDSEARYIITTDETLSRMQAASNADSQPLPKEKLLNVEELISSGTTEPVSIGEDETGDLLAYLIYTSGSTGRPKGVMLRHEGICNYLYGHPANVFAHAVKTDAERVMSVTTISFDAALQDIGMALYNGKTLVVATEEQANNPLQLAELISKEHIDMVSGTPSRWQTWLTSDDFCKAISQVKICRAGGEKFSLALLQTMRSTTRARIFNCYGPTEITVASNNAELTTAEEVTVGRPQLNVTEFIVDQDGNELPVGVVGELYIGGRGVARGYNNLDEITRERFVSYHGQRVYRSGDYARWLPDGNVAILGRTDHQIKLRGLRIELGEIENVMLRVEGMKKVVIVIRQLGANTQSGPGKEHLCAYYTADRTIAPDALKAEISKSLTQYMVPTAYLQLSEMPMTPNGKTDIKALPEPQLAATTAYAEPQNDGERTFCQIFADILQMDRVGATDNFFELGGTSLVVTRVIIEADKAGMHVAYGDVFANPTPRKLAQLVTGITVSSDSQPDATTPGKTDPVTDYDYSAIDALLAANTLSAFRKGERQPLGNVLITGATGYLGIHILHELIGSDVPHIYCLIRGKSTDAAESRLRTLLYYYFANAYKELFGQRIHVVLGDVTSDIDTSLPIDTVVNCAAVVKHFAEGTEIEDVNIGGAQRCVDFCLNRGARLVHISTASTRGLWVEPAKQPNDEPAIRPVFTEQRLFMGQYLGNKYIYSKFMAERLILDAVAHHGLKAKIMRVGNLAARSTDGEFQANFSTNSFMGRIRVYNMLGCCPYGMKNKRVEFSPINEVATAIVMLATTPAECTVFHPYNIHGQFLGDVLSGLSKVSERLRQGGQTAHIGVAFVEPEEFAAALSAAKNDPEKAREMSALLAYQDMAHGQATADVGRDNDYTTQVLYRLGFDWSPTSWDYVERMLTAIGGFGFFE